MFVPPSAAQEGPPARLDQGSGLLTLHEAVQLAIARNPSLAAVRLEAVAFGSDREEAAASRWPRLLTEADWHHTDSPVAVFSDKLMAAQFTAADFALDSLNHPDASSHESVAVAVEAPLYTSGRTRSAIEAANETSLAAQAQLREATAGLIAEVTSAYDAILLAQAAVEVAKSALDSTAGHERVATARFENGAALKSDVLRAQVQRLSRERDLERSQANLEIARARFATLLGATPGETWVLVEAERETVAAPLGDLRDWVAASAAGPEVEAARRTGSAAGAQERFESAARGLELGGIARYEWHANGLDPGEGSYFAGVSLRWTAYDRGRAARIDAAQARTAAAEARSRAVEDRARLEVEQAYRDAQVADHSIGTARRAVAAAEEARRITAERYAGGLLPLTDLLDAESALLQARLAEIGARFDASVSRVRLQRAAGRVEIP